MTATATVVADIDGSAPRGGPENAAADVGPAGSDVAAPRTAGTETETVAPDTEVELVGAATRPTGTAGGVGVGGDGGGGDGVGGDGSETCGVARRDGAARWAASLAAIKRPEAAAAAGVAAGVVATKVRESDFTDTAAFVSPGAHILTVLGAGAILAGAVTVVVVVLVAAAPAKVPTVPAVVALRLGAAFAPRGLASFWAR